MSIHKSGINDPMYVTASNEDQIVAELVKGLEKRISASAGVNLTNAREIIAKGARVAPGTIENISRGRSKGLRGFIRDQIIQFAMAKIQSEICRLEHDLFLARQCADRMDASSVIAAETALADAKRFMRKGI